ncbi:MAG: ATP-binding protein [Thermoplasmata archaeon]
MGYRIKVIIDEDNTLMPMSTVFVAREKELLLLKEYVDTALCGNANCVFIGGEAGIGKTTLVTKASRICSDKEL